MMSASLSSTEARSLHASGIANGFVARIIAVDAFLATSLLHTVTLYPLAAALSLAASITSEHMIEDASITLFATRPSMRDVAIIPTPMNPTETNMLYEYFAIYEKKKSYGGRRCPIASCTTNFTNNNRGQRLIIAR
mmetsp:Transcript_7749/g.11771  ORF Transcript_7749/g.11771 Transcript_7749/m.11771 type:complete len:136 (-) Transcript_7749:15-422(-)